MLARSWSAMASRARGASAMGLGSGMRESWVAILDSELVENIRTDVGLFEIS